MADLLGSIREDINARLAELRPMAEEAVRLERALAALGGTPSVAKTNGRASSRPAGGSHGRRSQTARGQTGQRIVEYVKANPGSTAGDVAKALGLKRNSTSTRLTQLANAGALTKDTRGYSAG